MFKIKDKSTIGGKLLQNFFFVILIAIIILEVLFILGIYRMSMDYTESLMRDNLDSAINSIIYRSDGLDITEILDPDFRQYFEKQDSQIQIINREGQVVFDSLGVLYDTPINSPDVEEAQLGRTGLWSGRTGYTNDRIMAMSRPIINIANQNIGVVRMVVSLSPITRVILKLSLGAIGAGLLSLFVVLIIARIFSISITKPLGQINSVARKLADGQYKERSQISSMVELEELSESLNYLADEVVKREELKNDFISSVSHELRTPLTSIKGWATTIQNAGKGNERILDDGLEIILSETDRLSDLVEDLLDFSRFSSGGISLEKEKVDLNFFLEDLIIQMQPQVLNAGHIFVVDIEDNLGPIVLDINRMKQVFINIFDNAIKFTHPTGVISIYGSKDSDRSITFTIRDTGYGMASDELKRVKDKFYKGNLGASHVGLGLSISDEIVKLHGYSLDIESELGVGTRVMIRMEASSD